MSAATLIDHGPRDGSPLSEEKLRSFLRVGKEFNFLKYLAKPSVYGFFDDFDQKALDTTNDYTVAAGATATTWAITAAEDGIVRGVAGTTAATSGLQISRPTKVMYGDRNIGLEVCYRLSDISEIRIEMGFANALPSVNTTIVNSLSTPTFNTVADGAVYVYNHTGSTTTTGLYTIGTAISAAKTATTTNRPVNDTYQRVRIQVVGNYVYLWVDGILLASHADTDYIEGGNGVIPFFSVKQSDTNDSNIDIDYIFGWKNRAA